MSKEFSNALVFVLALNALLFLTQVSIDNLNPNGPVFFNYEGSMLADFDKGNNTYVLDTNVETRMPSDKGSISVETGNWFTDLWSTAKNWVLTKTGGKYVIGAATALPNFLKVIGFPEEIVFALGFLWYAATLFFLVMTLKGG